MADELREGMGEIDEISADLFNQGLLGETAESVIASMDLFRTDERYDPNFVYDPEDTSWEDRIYAPTAAEMHPELVPDHWPPGAPV